MNREALINLRRVLIQLFDDPQTIQRVATDAGIATERIPLRGSVVDIWAAVLTEAQKTDQLALLVQVASFEYPNRSSEMQQYLQALSALAPSTPVDTPHSPSVTNAAARESRAADNQPTTQPNTTATMDEKPGRPAGSPTTATARSIPIDGPRHILLTRLEQQLLSTLFARADKLALKSEFSDGRTATRVFLLRPSDGEGRAELPAVAKVGPAALIEKEWQAAAQHVLNRLSGFAAVQGEPVYLADPNHGERWGALRYQQVGDSLYPVTSLAQYSVNATVGDIWYVLEERLLRQLRDFWQSTQAWQRFRIQQSYDAILPVNLVMVPLPLDAAAVSNVPRLDGAQEIDMTQVAQLQQGTLVHLRNFVVTESAADGKTLTLDLAPATGGGYRIRLQREAASPPVGVDSLYPATVAHVATTRLATLQQQAQSQVGASVALDAPALPLPEQADDILPNPLLALPDLLAREAEGWFATIHGDLNLRNILVETGARTAHIIDCANARHDHVLHDLLRMERDTVTDLLPAICFRDQLPVTAIVHFYRQLHCALLGPAHPNGELAVPADLHHALVKPFVMLATLRQTARTFLSTPNQWESYYTGLVIHLIGALKFSDLQQPTAGHKPIALAFWGAAVILDLLQTPQRTAALAQTIDWRFVNLTQRDLTQDKLRATFSKGLTPPASGDGSLGIVDEPPTLESATPGESTATDGAALAPVQRRLDIAAPDVATLGRAFSIAVAVRQLLSPPLAVDTLPEQRSGQAQLHWPAAEPFVRLRVQIDAPECDVVGDALYSFKLYHNLDSEVFYFSLIPRAMGRLNIIVRLYQEEDLLGSALAFTNVGEQEVGRVQVQLHSSDPIALPQDSPLPTASSTGDSSRPIKILFLAANPLDTVRRRIDEEARAIDAALQIAANRNFAIHVHQAVRIDDLQELLLRYDPDIVHFSGHGSAESELILTSAGGGTVRVSDRALRDLFAILKGNIRCMVLNACYSEAQATALAQVIDCVVGIENLISDEAAQQFATAFYRALGYERSIGDAFQLGKVQVALAGLGEAEAFHLLKRTNEAERFVFAGQPRGLSASSVDPAPPTVTANVHSSAASEESTFLESLLAQHKRNLQRLLQQKANFGAGEEPLRLLNQIDAEEEEIARLERELAGQG